MANLVICCDGTWNNPQQEDNGIPAPTNVVKLYNALEERDSDNPQVAYYHPGLGGEDSGLKDALLDGALGVSIKRHICSAYHWLASHYAPGDKVFIFGFSRGAFTARSLAGMLAHGLLDFRLISDQTRQWQQTHALYEYYKCKSRPLPESQFINHAKALPIDFIGVWDTVGALGIPNDMAFFNLFDNPERWRFHDTRLGEHIACARHAMALDEMRSSFTVTRWDPPATSQDIEEKWFPGVHSDVGGGYASTDLSDIALKWMMEEAQSKGLAFRDGVFKQLTPKPAGIMHNSYKGIFTRFRSRPRSVRPVSSDNAGVFHESVFERQRISPISYSLYWPTRRLAVNESMDFAIYAKRYWNASYLYMDKGERYTFSAAGQWQDSRDTCDWEGTEDGNLTAGDIIRFASSLWGMTERKFKQLTENRSTDFWGTKRIERLPWFIAVGCIANDSGRDIAVANDGSPFPHEYFALPNYRLPDQAKAISEPGYFYAFANDVWSLYDNNHGSITLTITRVA